MSKQVAFLGFPPTETFEMPTATPQPTASRHTRSKKGTRKPRFRYIMGYYITPSDCVQRLLDTGIAVTGESVDRAGRAFVVVSARLSAIGFKLGGPSFIDINLPTRTGYCLVLATSYVKGQILDVDEELKRKVKEAILTDEEPRMYRQQPGKYLQEIDGKDSGHLRMTSHASRT